MKITFCSSSNYYNYYYSYLLYICIVIIDVEKLIECQVNRTCRQQQKQVNHSPHHHIQ